MLSVSDPWNDSEVVNFWVIAFVVYCPHFFYSLVYIISLQSKFSPGPKKKKNTRTKRKLPFPTRPVFLNPDWTDPQFKQNMAPWPESGRGCMVRSGVPRSSLPKSLTDITDGSYKIKIRVLWMVFRHLISDVCCACFWKQEQQNKNLDSVLFACFRKTAQTEKKLFWYRVADGSYK